jgi:hypothetical protein
MVARLERPSSKLGDGQQLAKCRNQRNARILKRDSASIPSVRLLKCLEGEIVQAETDVRDSLNNMRAHIVTFAPDVRDAREDLMFFDHLAVECFPNAAVIRALVQKFIGFPESSAEFQRLDRTAGSGGNAKSATILEASGDKLDEVMQVGAKAVPVRQGLGAGLVKAMRMFGHTVEEACSHMGNMDPKTLRKLIRSKELVHQDSINRARGYISNSSK